MKTNLHISLILLGLILFILLPINSNAQLYWDKYEGNPVMTVQPGTWYSWNVFFPVVIYEDDIFKMWFCGNNHTPGRHIGYAESSDEIDWDILDDPVITSGDPGAWAIQLYPGAVLRIDDTLRMWFCGSTNNIDNGSIGYAWSVEEHIWNTHPEPVLEIGVSGAWDDMMVFHPSVYYDGTMYHMIYVGVDNITETWQLGYASSSNGINWEKYEDNPVIPLGPEDSFYDAGIINGCPIMYNDTIRLFFTGHDGTSTYPSYYSYMRIGYATSTDFKNWNIHQEPVLDVGDPGEWDEHVVAGPSVMIHDGFFKMWYWGGHDYSSWEIGYALGDSIDIGAGLPNEYKLTTGNFNSFPNPFDDQVSLSYQLQEKSLVVLEIYNYSGQQVSILVNEIKQQGKHESIFHGGELQPGIYFCVLKTNDGVQTKKIVKL